MSSSNKYPKIDAKHFHYASDGTGRDTYVSSNNGGLLSPAMLKSLEVSPKPTHTPMTFPVGKLYRTRSRNLPPALHTRVVHYYGDGKGRDNFVTINDGGQTQPYRWRSHVDNVFVSELRDYKPKWSEHPDAFKYLINNPKLRTQTSHQAKRQKLLSRQLSIPKLIDIPKNRQSQNYQSFQEPMFQSKARINSESVKD